MRTGNSTHDSYAVVSRQDSSCVLIHSTKLDRPRQLVLELLDRNPPNSMFLGVKGVFQARQLETDLDLGDMQSATSRRKRMSVVA